MTDSRSVRFLSAAIIAAAFAGGVRASDLREGAAPGQAAIQQEMQVMTLATRGGDAIALPGGSTISMPVEASGSGMIVGQVVDAGTGQPIADAIVSLGGSFGGGRGRGAMSVTMINGNISMGGNSDRPTIPRVMTDSEGRFAFRSIPKGSFDLSAQKNGYLDGAYGRLRPSGGSQRVALEDGERRTDLTVRLFKPAAISGVLVDDRGEPVVGADVRAYRRSLVSGRPQLVSTNYAARSDDRGMYRLSGLTPGDYVIAVPMVAASMPADFSIGGRLPVDLLSTMATPGNQGISLSFGGGTQVPGEDRFVLQRGGGATEPDGRVMTYATAYHPSAPSVSGAQAITVRSGEDRGGVDVTLALRPTASISGRLMGPKGPADTYALHLVPSDTGDLSSDPSVATTMTTSDGSFAFLGVPAGNYIIQTVRVPRDLGRMAVEAGAARTMMLTVIAPPGGAPPPPPAPPAEQDDAVLWTATPVSVDGGNVTGLAITLNEGIRISGRVEFEGAEPKPAANELRQLAIVATPADGRSRANIPQGRVDAEGRFTMPGLLPGRYIFSAAGVPRTWTYSTIMAGNVNAADVPLEVGTRDVGSMVVTFTDKISNLSGTVRNAEGRPDDSAAVIVFPADNRAWQDYGTNPLRMRMVRTSSEGAFSVGALPAGDYHLIAISDEVADEWQDPRFLETLSREATAVSIGLGEKATRELTRKDVRPIGGGSPAPASVPASAPAPLSGFAPHAQAGALLDTVGHIDADDARDRGPAMMDDMDDAPQQVRDARVDPAAPVAAGGAATISGVVVLDGETPQPVRRARVALRAADQRVERAVMTDDQGRFVISGLAAGRYSVSASKPAHVAGYFKSRPGRGPGAPLAVTAGQNLTGVTLRIAPGGVVSGRIVDESGNPFQGVSVRLMQYRTVSGERQLVPAAIASGVVPGPGGGGNAVTDDRGEYRIYGLAPGEYVVSATAPTRGPADMRQLSRDDVQRVVADLKQPPTRVPGGGAAPAPDPTPLGGRPVGYAPTFFPGTHTAAQAVPVDVTIGLEVRSIDMAVRLVPTARISGTIVGPDGRPMADAQLMVLQGDMSLMLSGGMTSMVRSGNDGAFTTGPLAPGRYAISARTGGGSQVMEVGGGGMFVSRLVRDAAETEAAVPPRPLWAQQDVDLGGQDISGVTLQMQEGMTVSGQLLFPPGSVPAPEDLTRVRLMLMPMTPGRMVMGANAPRVNADGTFRIDGVIPGSYRLNATVPAGGSSGTSRWTPGSAVAGDKDVLDTGLVIEPGRNVTGLTVNFTDQTSEISGTLMDPAGQPVSDLTVLLFPTDRAFWSPGSRRMRAPTQPGSDGAFKFTGLPPGEYFLAAVTELEPNAWGDPAVMDQIAAAAIRLSVAQGEKKVQDIKLAGG